MISIFPARQDSGPSHAQYCIRSLHAILFHQSGLYVSLPAIWATLGIIAVLLLLKMVTKLVGVFPLARMHFMSRREACYTTLLMATGLTLEQFRPCSGCKTKSSTSANTRF